MFVNILSRIKIWGGKADIAITRRDAHLEVIEQPTSASELSASENSVIDHFGESNRPDLLYLADWRIGSRKRPYLFRVTSSSEATAVFTAFAVAGVTISSPPTKTRTICPCARFTVRSKTLPMNPCCT